MNSTELKQLTVLAKAASPGPWTSGPDTAAGNVWVYRVGAPLFSPLRFVRSLLGKLPLFAVRGDSYAEWAPGETQDARRDRFWIQKQADAEFIAVSREAVPNLVAEIERLQTIVNQLDAFADGTPIVTECPCVTPDGHDAFVKPFSSTPLAIAKGRLLYLDKFFEARLCYPDRESFEAAQTAERAEEDNE